MAFIFLIQTVMGIMGNSSLFLLYIFPLLTGNHMRPIDLVLSQLLLANLIVLLSKGIPQTLIALGWKCFLSDISCKLVFYWYRVGSGVSVSTVSLFNGFQAIKLKPKMCRWIALKMQSKEFIGYCCLFNWFLHLLMNLLLPFLVNGPLNERNASVESNGGYCTWTLPAGCVLLYNILYFSPDVISLIFMSWASILAIVVLHRHKQRVQHIHTYSFSSSVSHEDRATCRILILVCFFTAFYSVYLSLTLWMIHAEKRGQWVVNSSVLLASCFPAFSPYVLILTDTRVSQVCFACRT
ncbi:vomeronasal type-1 receptor 1-like [Microtus ochrogaster]|uniref:Vomeronasal type-1 receptor n=1 Tax=Microtus ochrogaster TaxID=79684 RepID=A0ABM0LN33_MICOH|nr:vomeronasal type-1 receptor 1-like [Microtus ochrogaster]